MILFKAILIPILWILGFTSLLFSATIYRDTIVPIMVDDIIIFVPHTMALPDKDNDGIEDSLDTPIANAQELTLHSDTSQYHITLTGRDNDSAITFTLITEPTHGTLTGVAPNVYYTPNSGYEGGDSFTFRVNDGVHNSSVVTVQINITNPRIYGTVGTHPVTHYKINDEYNTTIYHPSDIAQNQKVPVVFFDPGYGSKDANGYHSLLTFIASHGYYVIYTKYSFSNIYHGHILDNDSDLLSKIDTTRIGVVGHSLGAGNSFSLLKFFSQKGYGENGRFLMALEAWYIFGMDRIDMKQLPSNTNVIMQQYGIGGNNSENNTDPRIPLSEYYLLDSIPNNQKDYQIYEDATHGYPAGNRAYSTMQGVLKPLDALMEYTFKGTTTAHDIALEVGNDDPYAKGNGIQVVNPINEYDYQCSANTSFDIAYCDMRQFVSIDTNHSIAKPDFNASYIDPAFASTVTRITDRSLQTGNTHPYPKQGSPWNSDGSIIRMQYRLYDATTFEELALTKDKNNDISYALLGSPAHGAADIRWSKFHPNRMYVLNSSRQFVQIELSANHSETTVTRLINLSSYSEVTTGNHEGNLDYDDNYIVFAARKDGDDKVYALLYKVGDTNLIWEKEIPRGLWDTAWTDPNYFDWVSIDPTGKYIMVSAENKIYLYDINLENEVELASEASHGDMGIDDEGNPVYVQFKFASEQGIWRYNLKTKEKTKLLPSKYNGGHITCRNYKYYGWCYMSSTQEGYREVLGIKLDNSGVVNRFAQTHFDTLNGDGGRINVSPDGQKVLFYSNWGEEDIPWDTYHVEFIK